MFKNTGSGSSAPQTGDKFTPAQKVTGQWMPMIMLSVNQLLVKWVAKIEILIKLFLINVEIYYNCLKLPFFGLKIRLLFTALFWIRNVYFGSGSDPDPVKSFGSLRIRFRIRIRNTACKQFLPTSWFFSKSSFRRKLNSYLPAGSSR